MSAHKVIISCALTGSIHTPSMSEFLPVTPAQIAQQGIDAARAGAAVLHLHARDPLDGRPCSAPDLFMQILQPITEATDAVCSLTTGGSLTMSLDERLAAPRRAQPELCSLNLGSMNFGLYPMLARRQIWRYDWEPQFLERSRSGIFRNTFADIEQILETMGHQLGARFEFECYDIAHLYTLAHLLESRRVNPPLFIQFILGILGGIGADIDNLVFMKRTADRLFGDGYLFSVLGAGRHQMSLGIAGALMGGHVRVGLEDNLYIAKGQLARDNAEQVRKLRELLALHSLEVATPTEARRMLALKGREQTAFHLSEAQR